MSRIDTKTYKNTTSVKGFLYRAIVEDNNDPEKLDRVRVRVLGVHIMEKTGSENVLHTDELPWAEVLAPTLFGMSTGIGISYVPQQGTWVWVFFENNDLQKPVVIGSTKGFVTKKQTDIGFTDPDKVYPLDDRLQEPDTNRLHRNEKYSLTTLAKERDPNLEKAVKFTTDGHSNSGSWDMPTELNTSTKYPDNNVIETKSGHFIEIDDTPGNERIHVYHTSGSFTEFRPDGTVSSKVIKDNFHVTNNNSYELVKKDKACTIQGNKENTTLKNEYETVSKDWLKSVGKVTSIKAGDNMYLTAKNIFLN